MNYQEFLNKKSQIGGDYGFEPLYIPDYLFNFQKYLLEWSLKKGRSAIFADCGLGKGQPENSKILTTKGYKIYKDLTLDDIVFDSQGIQRKIIGIYPKKEIDTYRFYYTDKTSHVFDIDHLHICRTNNDRQRNKDWKVFSTKELINKKLYYGNIFKRRNYDIPIVKPIQFDKKDLYISPYIMGVLLGNGHLKGNIYISTNDKDIIERIKKELPNDIKIKHKEKYDYMFMTGYTGNKRHLFRQELFDLKLLNILSNKKYIPEKYLYSDVNDRLELLRGLMDTDGYIKDTCQYYSVSKRLIENVKFLIQSLGGCPTLSEKKGKYKKNGIIKECQKCYILTFSLKTFNPFYLSRKSKLWNNNPRDNGRWIDKIEYECKQKTICISVDSPDHSYIIDDCIVTHNTIIELVWADNIVKKTNKPVLILTPLSVSIQTELEAEKFGIEAKKCKDGKYKNKIVITNYERLHYFNPDNFIGIVADESSILKNFKGHIKTHITQFMRKIPYRLLATATAAPNDYIELGTSSEALGYLGYMDMLGKFFKNEQNNCSLKSHSNRFHESVKWRLKGHAHDQFWKWITSWARACRKPSDLGFNDKDFILPKLNINNNCLKIPGFSIEGYFPEFAITAIGLKEERQETRATIKYRCEKVAEKKINDYCVIWCNLNEEGNLLEKIIPDSIQVSGRDSDDKKEEKLIGFTKGQYKILIIKPKIGAFGMNWQHCNNIIFFPTHSYEQFYQSVRRCWRFGQKRSVSVENIYTEGFENVVYNLNRKQKQAEIMFSRLIEFMNDSININSKTDYIENEVMPSWL